MLNLITNIQKICSDNNLDPKILIEFLKLFFGNSALELTIVAHDEETAHNKEKINVLILEKDVFFNFEYINSIIFF